MRVPHTINDATYANQDGVIMLVDRGAEENILLLGSCRLIAYANFMREDPRFDKYNICYLVCYLKEWEDWGKEGISAYPPNVLKNLMRTTILVHEKLGAHWGNLQTDCIEEGIGLLGVNPGLTVPLPNMDACIYYEDILAFAPARYPELMDKIRAKDPETLQTYQHNQATRMADLMSEVGLEHSANFFMASYKRVPMMVTVNHPSNMMFMAIYTEWMRKYLDRTPAEGSVAISQQPDFLGGHNTPLTEVDRDILGYEFIKEIP